METGAAAMKGSDADIASELKQIYILSTTIRPARWISFPDSEFRSMEPRIGRWHQSGTNLNYVASVVKIFSSSKIVSFETYQKLHSKLSSRIF